MVHPLPFLKAKLSGEQFDKLLYWKTLHSLNANPGCRFCPGCTAPILGCPETQFWDCFDCKKCFCVACFKDRKEHNRKGSCNKFRVFATKEEKEVQMMTEFKQMEAEAGNHVCVCPGCSIQFQKISGCNHITCPNPSCRKEFCYLCGGDYYNPVTGDYHFDGTRICDGSMSMAEYIQRTKSPEQQTVSPVLSIADRNRQQKRRRTIAIVATSPLWVPVSPLLLIGYGAYRGYQTAGPKITQAIAEAKKSSSPRVKRQRANSVEKSKKVVIVHPDGTAIARTQQVM